MTEVRDDLKDRLRSCRRKVEALKKVAGLRGASLTTLQRLQDTTDAALARIEELERERDEARSIVRDIHWMAVRYADGRRSYAPGMCNDALRKAYDAGWLVYSEFRQHDLDPQYAREGDKPEYLHAETRGVLAEREAILAMLAVDGPHSPRRYIYDTKPDRRIWAMDKLEAAIRSRGRDGE